MALSRRKARSPRPSKSGFLTWSMCVRPGSNRESRPNCFRPPPMQSLKFSLPALLAEWWHELRPAPMRVDARERARIVLGAGIGIVFTAWLSHMAGGSPEAGPLLVGPIGARAVRGFGV